MDKSWLSHPWIERFLPDHLRPVDDHIFSDAHGTEIITETEAALNRLIQYGEQVKGAQTFKKNGKTFQFRLKINQKRMRLLSYETPKSEAAIKKRIIIEYTRKAYAPKNSQKRFKEATVQYIKNGQTYVRSIQKSHLFQNVFHKLEELDDALLGKLMKRDDAPLSPPPVRSEEKPVINTTEEPKQLLRAIETLYHEEWRGLDSILLNRLDHLLQESRQIIEMFDELDIEERYMLKRMLQKDIPSLIDTYHSLTNEQKQVKKEQLYEALIKMELKLKAIREKTEQQNAEKMEQLLKLNDKRYSSRSKHH
ncbi:hypothetical protein [Alteribacillus iranensis]|uniref:Uncharacterized protein n=1 Tax=Alteribacillus iranensis TaxID=930128 RepID=A0A1I1ZYF9_9BACI|nr:hypothetical protein [Alteribacillus iranensis]SFE35490.1 hypothetical protein SAMN05192532_101460 [Alteribacillus iranensis]